MGCSPGQIVSSDFPLSYSDLRERDVGEQGRFEAFAAPPQGGSWRPGTVHDRVTGPICTILSAWAMQKIAERQLDAIRSPHEESPDEELPEGRDWTGGHIDVSPQGIFLVVHCLEKTLDVLHRLRALSPLLTSPQAPAATDVSVEVEFDSDLDPDTVFDLDFEIVGDSLADLSNEWPVVPRGRSVEEKKDADPPDTSGPRRGTSPPLLSSSSPFDASTSPTTRPWSRGPGSPFARSSR